MVIFSLGRMVASKMQPAASRASSLWRMFGRSGVPHDQHVSVALLLAKFCPHIPCPGGLAFRSCLSGQTMMATYRILCGLRTLWRWTSFSPFICICSTIVRWMSVYYSQQVTLCGPSCTWTHGCIKNAARCMTSVFFVAYVRS